MPGKSTSSSCPRGRVLVLACFLFSDSKTTLSRYSTFSSARSALRRTFFLRSRASKTLRMAASSSLALPASLASSAFLVHVSLSFRSDASSSCSVVSSSRAARSSSAGRLRSSPVLRVPSRKSRSSSSTKAPAFLALPKPPDSPTAPFPSPSRMSPKIEPKLSPPVSYSASIAACLGPLGGSPDPQALRARWRPPPDWARACAILQTFIFSGSERMS
mmetsp:Transcript_12845/g.38672  ORF Transcript_12845/g.38672 Transcript_12845/m.38672 type:complete len:217 (-) Transcript_12845:125-775(-)